MNWSNELILEFIKLLEAEPAIWNLKDPLNKKKDCVYQAWLRIQSQFGTEISIDNLKKKKESLMAYYRIHIAKIKKCIHLGEDQTFHHSWFAFNSLHSFLGPLYMDDATDQNPIEQNEHESFLEEKTIGNEVKRKSTKGGTKRSKVNLSTEMMQNKKPIWEFVDAKGNSTIDEYIKRSPPNDEYVKRCAPNEYVKRVPSNDEYVRRTSDEYVNGRLANDEYEIFGKLIAAKIRKIQDPNKRDMLMNDIHSMVTEVCMSDSAQQQSLESKANE